MDRARKRQSFLPEQLRAGPTVELRVNACGCGEPVTAVGLRSVGRTVGEPSVNQKIVVMNRPKSAGCLTYPREQSHMPRRLIGHMPCEVRTRSHVA